MECGPNGVNCIFEAEEVTITGSIDSSVSQVADWIFGATVFGFTYNNLKLIWNITQGVPCGANGQRCFDISSHVEQQLAAGTAAKVVGKALGEAWSALRNFYWSRAAAGPGVPVKFVVPWEQGTIEATAFNEGNAWVWANESNPIAWRNLALKLASEGKGTVYLGVGGHGEFGESFTTNPTMRELEFVNQARELLSHIRNAKVLDLANPQELQQFRLYERAAKAGQHGIRTIRGWCMSCGEDKALGRFFE